MIQSVPFLTKLRVLALGIACAASALPVAAAASITPGRVEFAVTRNGQPFGTHSVVVSKAGDGYTARSDIRLVAKVGPVTAFNYTHRCVETWRSALSLASLDCTDRENGRVQTARANLSGNTLHINGSGFSGPFIGEAIPSSWWRRDTMEQSKILDTRNGKPMPINIQRVGIETVKAGAATVQATRFRVKGTLVADVWYDAAGRWVKLAFKARGQDIVYTLASPLAAIPRS